MARPDIRLVFKSKSSGKTYECAAGWITEWGAVNLKLVETSEPKADYPKLNLPDLLKALNSGDGGYLTLYAAGRDSKIVIQDPSASIGADDFGATDDIPF